MWSPPAHSGSNDPGSGDVRTAWQSLFKDDNAPMGISFQASLPFTPLRLQRLTSAEDVSRISPISQTRKECFGFTLTGSAAPHPHPLAPSAGHSLASSFARFNATPSEAIIASSIGPALAQGTIEAVLLHLELFWLEGTTVKLHSVLTIISACAMSSRSVAYPTVWDTDALATLFGGSTPPPHQFIPCMGLLGPSEVLRSTT
jgi:hypothetical protein